MTALLTGGTLVAAPASGFCASERCRCVSEEMVGESIEERIARPLEYSDTPILARVVAVDALWPASGPPPRATYPLPAYPVVARLAIEREWTMAGVPSTDLRMTSTPVPGSSCDASPAVGSLHLIFARYDDRFGWLNLSLCDIIPPDLLQTYLEGLGPGRPGGA